VAITDVGMAQKAQEKSSGFKKVVDKFKIFSKLKKQRAEEKKSKSVYSYENITGRIATHNLPNVKLMTPDMILSGEKHKPAFSDDIYATGILFYHLLTGVHPTETVKSVPRLPDGVLSDLESVANIFEGSLEVIDSFIKESDPFAVQLGELIGHKGPDALNNAFCRQYEQKSRYVTELAVMKTLTRAPNYNFFKSISDILAVRFRKHTYKSPHELDKNIPIELSNLIMDCISYDAQARPDDASAVLSRLEKIKNIRLIDRAVKKFIPYLLAATITGASLLTSEYFSFQRFSYETDSFNKKAHLSIAARPSFFNYVFHKDRNLEVKLNGKMLSFSLDELVGSYGQYESFKDSISRLKIKSDTNLPQPDFGDFLLGNKYVKLNGVGSLSPDEIQDQFYEYSDLKRRVNTVKVRYDLNKLHIADFEDYLKGSKYPELGNFQVKDFDLFEKRLDAYSTFKNSVKTISSTYELKSVSMPRFEEFISGHAKTELKDKFDVIITYDYKTGGLTYENTFLTEISYFNRVSSLSVKNWKHILKDLRKQNYIKKGKKVSNYKDLVAERMSFGSEWAAVKSIDELANSICLYPLPEDVAFFIPDSNSFSSGKVESSDKNWLFSNKRVCHDLASDMFNNHIYKNNLGFVMTKSQLFYGWSYGRGFAVLDLTNSFDSNYRSNVLIPEKLKDKEIVEPYFNIFSKMEFNNSLSIYLRKFIEPGNHGVEKKYLFNQVVYDEENKRYQASQEGWATPAVSPFLVREGNRIVAKAYYITPKISLVDPFVDKTKFLPKQECEDVSFVVGPNEKIEKSQSCIIYPIHFKIDKIKLKNYSEIYDEIKAAHEWGLKNAVSLDNYTDCPVPRACYLPEYYFSDFRNKR
ncbi:MAG: hypothetical protein Q8O89_04720, partial [Nanoarchaeota archaeon]|nr:hypothetical protein [Nanoarchaeota archaeon]